MKISTNWRKEIQTIPNLLSIFRILLLPIYLYFVLRQSFYVAGAVIVVSGLSDYLDGVIARRYNQVTDLGKVLDPFADKLTQLFPDFVYGMVSTVALAVVWSILDKRRLYVCSWINRAI